MAEWSNHDWDRQVSLVYDDATGRSALEVSLGADGCNMSVRLVGMPISEPGQDARVLFPGSFNPLHDAHRRMAQLAGSMFSDHPFWYEISVDNLDKPQLTKQALRARVHQRFVPGNVVITHTGSFEAKARRFPGSIFVVGADTIARIPDSRFYRDERHLRTALHRIAHSGCRFLVFARRQGDRVIEGPELELPDALEGLCQWVPKDQFCLDLSSTEIRNRTTLDSPGNPSNR